MKKYNLAEKIIDDKDIAKLTEWLKTDPRLTKGKLTLQFEEEWAKYIGTKYAVFCNSGEGDIINSTWRKNLKSRQFG